MKKILLFLSTALLLSNGAQAQNSISFEASEGYTLGSIENQNGWLLYDPSEGETYTPEVIVSDQRATHGNRSFRITAQNILDYVGGFYFTQPVQENFSISMDVYVESTFTGLDNGSEILLDLVDENLVSLAQFNFGFDNTIYGGTNGWLSEIEGLTYENDRWYTIRYDVDFDAQVFRLYLNDTFIYEEAFETGTQLAALDFYMFDMGTSLNVDNIQIQPLANLGTAETKKSMISIYPNPVIDVIQIKTNEALQSAEIYDLTGRLIQSTTASSIPVQNLQSGAYVLKIKTNQSTTSKKFIKK